MRDYRRCGGLTLLELLITLTIMTVLVSYTGSHWGVWANDSRHDTLVKSYHQTFSFARWMAVTKRSIVTVCPLSATGRCQDNWNGAVSIFPDANNDKQPDDNEIWRILPPPMDAYQVRSRTGGRGYFQFNANGMIHGASGSLVLCPTHSKGKMSYLAINRGGRFRSTHSENGGRTIRLQWGAQIQCP